MLKAGSNLQARLFVVIIACAFILSGDLENVEQIRSRLLLQELSDAGSFGGGRLTGMPLPRAQSGRFKPVAYRRGILPFGVAKTPSQHRILSMVYALEGEFGKAEAELTRSALLQPNEPTIENDLGVIRMGLARSDPMAWFTAGQYFESALAQRPNFPEAQFNLILTYRHLGLRRTEASLMTDFKKVEHNPSWRRLVADSRKSPTQKSLAQRIRAATPEEISEIVKNTPAQAREIVLTFAFNPALPIPQNYLRVAYELGIQYGDNTTNLAIAALSTNEFARVVRIRQLLTTQRDLYLRGRYGESRKVCDQARALAKKSRSLFDQLSAEISEADISAVQFDFPQAAKTYLWVAQNARKNKAQWILARALASLGAAPALSSGLSKTLSNLNEAIALYRSIGETKEMARPLYYLAADNFIAASYPEGLKFALEALDAADPSDHFRLSQLCFAVSGALSITGVSNIAVHFSEEGVDEAKDLGNPLYLARMRMQLASTYLSVGQERQAIDQIETAETLLPQLHKRERDIADIVDKMFRGRIAILLHDYSRAETEFRDTLALIAKYHDDALIQYDLESEMSYARVLAALGKTDAADSELHNAVGLVETGQNNFSDDNLQLTFDADRREVYESAINFEFGRGSCEDAWRLSQGYKGKLFLSRLTTADSTVRVTSSKRLSIRGIQRLLPHSTAVLDYVTLTDKVLVWIISKDSFDCRSIAVNSQTLQNKVDLFASLLREKQPVTELSQDLYNLLVQSIGDSIEAVQTFVVIPDRCLYRLPFAALQSGRDGRYWVETASIMESPSISYFFAGRPDIASSKNSHVAFGSRTYDFMTNTELQTIQKIDPTIRSYLGPVVTRQVFLHALRDNNVVYYAGHAAADVTNALQSSILLDGGGPGPNSVSAVEITEQRIAKNSTVILSSCETSIGNSRDGAGLGGLTSAFLVGGAGSVVGSLWEVESSSTAKLMSSMFRFFVRNRRPITESLRQAQIQMLRDRVYSHPYYWSGFRVTGNRSALALSD